MARMESATSPNTSKMCNMVEITHVITSSQQLCNMINAIVSIEPVVTIA